METILPAWAASLRDRYLSGEASVFLLHGNTRDIQPSQDPDGTLRYTSIREFLERFLGRTKDLVVYYNLSEGVEFGSRSQETAFKRVLNSRRLMEGREPVDSIPRSPGQVLPLLEELVTDPTQRASVVIDYVETIIPNGDLSFMGDSDKNNLVTLLRLGGDPALVQSDNLVILVTETLADVHRRLVASTHVAALEVPLPSAAERETFLRSLDRRGIVQELDDSQLAKVTAGLSLSQVRGLMRQARQSGLPITFRTVNQRKKAIIEQECHSLVEFVDPAHDFSHVGGMESVKTELMRIADAIKNGQRNRVPMGLIFVGPMGTGKTFLAEAFARESGLTCLKFKNFREKWVGSTEGNLEKILQVVDGLGYVLLILDEADRSLSSGSEGDGGTSSRVIARLKEFMSDTSHRGRVVILMMTNRPDKLDVDLKRPGRFDVKIPFFFPETSDERRQVTAAVLRKAQIELEEGAQLDAVVDGTGGYSAAEIEAVVLAAANFAAWDGRERLSEADLTRAVVDLIPSRDARMLEYMELLAVFESSSRRMLPERYQGMSTQEVQARLDVVRAQLGQRVA
ncbi:MAG: ATP-binding protein [Pseudomonadota bacterium]|nr:ATP-binding protein [Pseudomonadota bacterium]